MYLSASSLIHKHVISKHYLNVDMGIPMPHVRKVCWGSDMREPYVGPRPPRTFQRLTSWTPPCFAYTYVGQPVAVCHQGAISAFVQLPLFKIPQSTDRAFAYSFAFQWMSLWSRDPGFDKHQHANTVSAIYGLICFIHLLFFESSSGKRKTHLFMHR